MIHSVVKFVLDWLLYLALFPIVFVWFRQIWRILISRDYSDVALRKGLPPPNPERVAPFVVALNLIAGIVLLGVILSVPSGSMAWDDWVAIAGSTIWMKLMLGWGISRHAHFRADRKAYFAQKAADQAAKSAANETTHSKASAHDSES